MYKEYKVGDLVHFDYGMKVTVGKIVWKSGYTCLVHSPSIDGHNGNGFAETQDNCNNYFFGENQLSPFTKKVGQRYKYIGDYNGFRNGEIITLVEIYDDACSVYTNGINDTRLYDVNSNECEPEVQYLDEGVDNNRPTLEVGMVIGFELDDGAQSSEMRIIKEYDVKDYQSRTSINRVYKPRENGDLELIWQREQLYTLQCPLTNQYLSKLTPDIENLFWVDVDWDKFTKEETIKIGEHLDWKKVQ